MTAKRLAHHHLALRVDAMNFEDTFRQIQANAMSADPLPQSFHHPRTGADGLTGSGIVALFCASPLGHSRLLCRLRRP
jgi:hypothetical protein